MTLVRIHLLLYFCFAIVALAPQVLSKSEDNNDKHEDESGLFKRFDYKYSFKGPYLAQPDGNIPFWEKRGNALPSDKSVRLTPSLRKQRGALWGKNKTTFESWEVELTLRISGRGRHGGDGVAFWYLDQKPGEGVTGSVFGGPDGPWNGLAIFFDSYDNDGKFDNPVIMGIYNPGSINYDIDNDGLGQSFGSCHKDFRNRPFPLKARIRYNEQTLSLYFNNGLNKGEEEGDLELCFQVFDVKLPRFGYFGVTGATGTIADDQDVYKFLTYSLSVETSKGDSGDLNDGEKQQREKIDHEYQSYQDKLEKQKKEYKQEHPDFQPKDETDEEAQYWDEEYAKEFLKIFNSQKETRSSLIVLKSKIELVLGKHESISITVQNYHNSVLAGNVSIVPMVAGTGTNAPCPFQKFEVENLLTSGNELISLSNEIKQLAEQLRGKTQGIVDAAEIPGIPSNDPGVMVKQIEVEIGSLQSEMKSIYSKLQETSATSTHTTLCISTFNYVLLSSVVTTLILFYLIYKDHVKAGLDAKKFY